MWARAFRSCMVSPDSTIVRTALPTSIPTLSPLVFDYQRRREDHASLPLPHERVVRTHIFLAQNKSGGRSRRINRTDSCLGSVTAVIAPLERGAAVVAGFVVAAVLIRRRRPSQTRLIAIFFLVENFVPILDRRQARFNVIELGS